MTLILVVLVMQMSVRVVREGMGRGSRLQIPRCARLYMLFHVLVLVCKRLSIGTHGSLEVVRMVYRNMARLIKVHVSYVVSWQTRSPYGRCLRAPLLTQCQPAVH